MIKAIIFDLGGVVLNLDKLLKQTEMILRPKDSRSFWQELNRLAIDWNHGKADAWSFCHQAARMYGQPEKANLLYGVWMKDYAKYISVNDDIVSLVRSLRKKYKIILLSNTNQRHDQIIRKLGIYKLFDTVILSYRVGMSKHEPQIFRFTTEKLGLRENECLFIDDTKLFVDTARSIGMRAVLFENPKQLKRELRHLLR